jgi:hypothetical protein
MIAGRRCAGVAWLAGQQVVGVRVSDSDVWAAMRLSSVSYGYRVRRCHVAVSVGRAAACGGK